MKFLSTLLFAAIISITASAQDMSFTAHSESAVGFSAGPDHLSVYTTTGGEPIMLAAEVNGTCHPIAIASSVNGVARFPIELVSTTVDPVRFWILDSRGDALARVTVTPVKAGQNDDPGVGNTGTMGTSADGEGGPGVMTGKCNKTSGCRLKIVFPDGTTVEDKLKKDETYQISAKFVVYTVCGCD